MWSTIITMFLVCALCVVAIKIVLSTSASDLEWKEYLAEVSLRDALPWIVIAVNGEVALCERWDGHRIDFVNPFTELAKGMLVEIDDRTVIDYIEWMDM
jgi:sulfur carrier protein ThiS